MRRRRRTAERRKKEVVQKFVFEASCILLLENANVQRPDAESILHSCFYSRHLGTWKFRGRGPWTTRCTENIKEFFFFPSSPGNNGVCAKTVIYCIIWIRSYITVCGGWHWVHGPQGVQLGVTSLCKNACHWYGWKTRCQFGCAGVFWVFFSPCCCFFSLGVMGIIYITGMKYDT